MLPSKAKSGLNCTTAIGIRKETRDHQASHVVCFADKALDVCQKNHINEAQGELLF